MSFVSASNMEIVTEQPEIASTLIDDVDKLISFVRRYNNSIPEYIRVARMYFFGTPIRRTGSGFRRATPGCIRLKLFSSRQENSDEAASRRRDRRPALAELAISTSIASSSGGASGPACQLEPFSWKVFHPRDRKTISGAAIHNLTYGRQNNMFLICKPSIRVSSLSRTYFLPCSLPKSDGRVQARRARHMGPRAQVSAPRPRRTTPRGTSTASSRSAPFAWLVSLVPGTLDVLAAAALALVAVVRWARELLMALPEHARTRSF
ncbi:hypothetical protein EDB92DRAFT_1942793 [Lactarius akahatsu]|uniref:Uncharacterized protein n=1 Tax=Lactarius akahatsu TaxID=416441 RepID=A0AAD4QFQ4_9AGAM|nr:hypothetical protein EDB92DRAFT_1942793 [Lactarius akahatsu]